MNRFSFLVLVAIVGYVSLPVEAEPTLISQVGDFDRPDSRYMDQRAGEPATPPPKKLRGKLLGGASSAKKLKKNTIPLKMQGKAVGKIVPSKVKSKKLNPKTVGDFGKLPTNSYQPKQNVDGAAPPHPSDFGTVPVESGPDTRTAK